MRTNLSLDTPSLSSQSDESVTSYSDDHIDTPYQRRMRTQANTFANSRAGSQQAILDIFTEAAQGNDHFTSAPGRRLAELLDQQPMVVIENWFTRFPRSYERGSPEVTWKGNLWSENLCQRFTIKDDDIPWGDDNYDYHLLWDAIKEFHASGRHKWQPINTMKIANKPLWQEQEILREIFHLCKKLPKAERLYPTSDCSSNHRVNQFP